MVRILVRENQADILRYSYSVMVNPDRPVWSSLQSPAILQSDVRMNHYASKPILENSSTPQIISRRKNNA